MTTPEALDYGAPKTPRIKRRRIHPVILVLLLMLAAAVVAGLAIPVYVSDAGSHINPTRAGINMIKQALNTFEVDHDRWPTTAEGLDALVHQPKGLTDWHPYLEKLPVDAWSHPFVYRSPSTTGAPFYDLYSLGPDGIDGTADDIYEDK